jgi:hypothetical protein
VKITYHTYNWCGHPAFGTSYNEIHFNSRDEALEYAARFGYEV